METVSNNSSAVLTLDHSGELSIVRQGGEPIILYSSPQAINNTVATLLDNSNFVLQELHPNGSTKRLLWQSFDYRSNTLIPGMKLGVNHKTGHIWSLTSWLTNLEPSLASSFTLEWDPKGGELSIRRSGKVYWKSGVLKRNRRFENIPEEAQHGYEYTIVSNEDEDYFSFSFQTQNGDRDIMMWNLKFNGDLEDEFGNLIARASKCYGYNTDGGCQRWNSLASCRHKGQEFVRLIGYFNGSNFRLDSNTSLGITDCRETCWNKCSYHDCVGYRTLFENETGCFFYYRNSSGPFIEAEAGDPHFVLKPFEEEHKGTKRWLWAIAVIVGALFISCAGIICLLRKRRKAQKKITRNAVLDLVTFYGSDNANELQKDEKNGHDLRVFSYASVLAATNSFSSENKLGEGGFGPVYKAWDLWTEGVGLELLDPSINDSFIPDQVMRCIHVALLCVEERPVDWPTMSDIFSMLTNESATLPLPNRPAFYFRRMTNMAKESLQKPKIVSINGLSISDLQAR